MALNTAASRWTKLDSKRSQVLQRARDCAHLTIPHILPPSGHDENSNLSTPYQGLGARGVNNLASKLLLALLPPNSPFFKFAVDDTDVAKLAGDPKLRTSVEKALSNIERTVMADIESSNTRTALFESLKHLIVTGNVLMFTAPDGSVRFWKLDQYVVARDYMGFLLDVIIHEKVAPSTLEPEVIEVCGIQNDPDDKDVDVYTVIHRDKNNWSVHQEINDVRVPDSDGTYPHDKPAYLALRLSAVAGESYGRGVVEEYLGDLRSLEGLQKSIVIAAAASAKVLFLRSPNATTRAKDIAQAESGDIVTGQEGDVTVLQVGKYNDFRVAMELVDTISQRIAHAFLLNTAVQRNAERVTAEEIRYVAQELEDALGGIYSVLTQELQLPFVARRMAILEKRKKLPNLPDEIVRPVMTTGLEALGRGHDISKLRSLLEDMAPLGPEVLSTWMNVGDYIQRAATARGINSDGLIKSAEEVQQAQQQMAMQQALQQAGPDMINQAMQGANPTQGNT